MVDAEVLLAVAEGLDCVLDACDGLGVGRSELLRCRHVLGLTLLNRDVSDKYRVMSSLD